jgi:hypothetical protein
MDFESRPLIIPTPTRKPVFLLHSVDAEVLPFCLRLTTFWRLRLYPHESELLGFTGCFACFSTFPSRRGPKRFPG